MTINIKIDAFDSTNKNEKTFVLNKLARAFTHDDIRKKFEEKLKPLMKDIFCRDSIITINVNHQNKPYGITVEGNIECKEKIIALLSQSL